mmetsp:Transcript_46077/g.108711  ORF Transcript_46077/g.108711 Transcript_46077/m.108711 type:complete len:342 (+) Transcript_46077:216-1241(+)
MAPLEVFDTASFHGNVRADGGSGVNKRSPAGAAAKPKEESLAGTVSVQRREALAFLSDEEISAHPIYRTVQKVTCGAAYAMHGFSVEGWHRLPRSKGCLLVGIHTTHSGDILPCMLHAQAVSGQVVRGLLHRLLVLACPIIRYIGAVPGYRDTAYELLKSGNWVAVIPGGAEEIMAHATANGKDAYTLSWESASGNQRAGFAKVAQSLGSGFEIYPCFSENGEEMRFNPMIVLWAYLGLDVLCGRVIRMTPPLLCAFLIQMAVIITFAVTNFSIPLPVKVTQHIGEAVTVRVGESPEELALRVHDALQALIDAKQGRRHRDYWAALRNTWGARAVPDAKRK